MIDFLVVFQAVTVASFYIPLVALGLWFLPKPKNIK
jgi:hypothetical protein